MVFVGVWFSSMVPSRAFGRTTRRMCECFEHSDNALQWQVNLKKADLSNVCKLAKNRKTVQ